MADSQPGSTKAGPGQPWSGPGPSPLWAFAAGAARPSGAANSSGAACGVGTAAGPPALPPEIGEFIYGKVLQSDWPPLQLRLVDKAARTYHDERTRRLKVRARLDLLAAALREAPPRFPQLQELAVDLQMPGLPLGSAALLAALSGAQLPQLSQLSTYALLGTHPKYPGGASGMQLLARAPWFGQLTELELHLCDLSAAGDLRGLAAPALQRLRLLRPRGFDGAGVAPFARLGLPALQELYLNVVLNRPGGGSCLAALLLAPGLAGSLQRLELVVSGECNYCGDELLEFLVHLQLPALRSLAVEVSRSHQMSAVALAAAARAAWAPQLTELKFGNLDGLGLGGTFAEDEAALQALAGAPLHALRVLALPRAFLPPAGLLALFSASWLSGLQHLSFVLPVSKCELAAFLADAPALQALHNAGAAHIEVVDDDFERVALGF